MGPVRSPTSLSTINSETLTIDEQSFKDYPEEAQMLNSNTMAGSPSSLAAISNSSVFCSAPVIRPRYGFQRVSCVSWDPEGILGNAQTGHIARLQFRRRLEKDASAREEFERQIREEKERRRELRQSRIVPDTAEELIEFFLDTEAQEIEFEIARLRPRLNEEFFSKLKFELGKLRFAVSKTQDMEDRVIELEALEKALNEGAEAYDRMQGDIVMARETLHKILTSKDVKAMLLEMVEANKLNRALLTLLDENIASANQSSQKDAVAFMGKLRSAVVKYMTV